MSGQLSRDFNAASYKKSTLQHLRFVGPQAAIGVQEHLVVN